MGKVNGPRFVADSELAPKIGGALKIVRAPGRLALSKNTGNGDGAGEQMKIGAGRPGGGKNGVRTKSGFQPLGTGQGG